MCSSDEDGDDFVINIVQGGRDFQREVESEDVDRTFRVAKSGLAFDTLQVAVLDWAGTEDGGDGIDEIVVIGQPGPHATDPDAARTAGWVFDGADIAGSEPVSPLITVQTDITERSTVKDRVFGGDLGDAPTTSALVLAAVGDVNNDGYQDLLIGRCALPQAGPDPAAGDRPLAGSIS